MLRYKVNPNFDARLSDTDTTLSFPYFYRHAYRFFIAAIALALVMLISTSYLRSPKNLNEMGMEFCTPAGIDSLRNTLSDYTSVDQPVIHGERTLVFESVRNFYRLNEYRPVWTHARGLSKRADNLLGLISRARDFGLEPSHYHVSAIREIQQTIGHQSPEDKHTGLKIELELLMTDAALSLMVNLHTGYAAFDSALFSKDWFATLPAVLYTGIRQGSIQECILSMQPDFIEYVQLQRATEKYLQANTLTDKQTEISYPAKDSVILRKQIREALISLGYLMKNSNEQDFTEALKKFQHYHGLEPDGKPGNNTVEALAQSSLFGYRRLVLNLDRLRKQECPDSVSLVVNIPAYQLKVFNNNVLIDTFRVIVGNPSSPTPLLKGEMQTIIANPVWFVPKKIAMNEILPKIKSDSGYLKRNGFKILDENYRTVSESSINMAELSADNFNYTFRQNRGTDNSLGQVKFIFSNPYAIYLHDTPGKMLFSKDIRAFSHGCVRIKDPERLAGYIIHEINADTTNIGNLIRNGRHYEINIAGKLPIYIRYITCEADTKGNVFFYKDIYGFDKKELEELTPLMGI
jgi:L,D-transpeptidase YcbB